MGTSDGISGDIEEWAGYGLSYPWIYHVYRNHCKEKSSSPSILITCNGSLMENIANQTILPIQYTPDSEMFKNLTISLCNDLFPIERKHKLLEICPYQLQRANYSYVERITLSRQGNTVISSNIDCSRHHVAYNNTCYLLDRREERKSLESHNVTDNISGLCDILKEHSVNSPMCTDHGEMGAKKHMGSAHSYLITAQPPLVTSVSSCGHHQYICSDGHCISDVFQGDGINDCPDGSDESELECQERDLNETGCRLVKDKLCVCSIDKYSCEGTQCILWHQICDGKVDCPSANEELSCIDHKSNIPSGDSESVFNCQDGTSISYDLVDDFLPDCPQAEDELHLLSGLSNRGCHNPTHIPCVPGHPRCFPPHVICVYDLDQHGHVKYCRNGAHLAHCTYIGCPYRFKCPHYYCIPTTSLCDGMRDCPNGEDEMSCDYLQAIRCPGMFYCRGRTCVQQHQVCDGAKDCPEGDDENHCDRQAHTKYCQAKGSVLICTSQVQLSKLDIFQYRALKLVDGIASLDFIENVTSLFALNISQNGFSQLKPYQFQEYISLKILDISYNSIATLPGRAFAGLTHLVQLIITGNSIAHLSRLTFDGLIGLKFLNLSNLSISEIQYDCFKLMTNLRTLDLSHNLLKTINISLNAGHPLVSLSLSHNPLDYYFPSDIEPISPYTLITNTPYLCCFSNIFNCCDTKPILSNCLNLLNHGTNASLIVYGLFIMIANCTAVVLVFQRMSSSQRRNEFATLCVFVLDIVLGVYLTVTGLAVYVNTQGFIHKPYGLRHNGCWFGAWLQLFLSNLVNSIKTKHAFNYMKQIDSGILSPENRFTSSIRWIILMTIVSVILAGASVLFPLIFNRHPLNILPICSLLLGNVSEGYKTCQVSLGILVGNVAMTVITLLFIGKVWRTVALSRKTIQALGTMTNKKEHSQYVPGLRMIIRASCSLIANVYGISLCALVDSSTLDSVSIPVSLTFVFNSPSLINPLTYIVYIYAYKIEANME